METARPVIFAIDGRSGSGKTQFALDLARHLSAHYTVNILHLEDMYRGWDSLADTVARFEALAPELAGGLPIQFEAWDWQEQRPGPQMSFTPAQVVIVEGVGAAARSARGLFHASIWLEVEDQLRKDRALARDGQVYAPHWDRWAAQERDYLAAHAPQEHCTIVLSPTPQVSAVQGLMNLAPYLEAETASILAPESETGCILQRYTQRPAPTDPAAVFEHLAQGLKHSALLESTSHHLFDPLDRNQFTIMAFALGASSPVLRAEASGCTVHMGGDSAKLAPSFFTSLARIWPGQRCTPAPYPQPAWVGFMGYELKREVGAQHEDCAPASGGDACFFAPNLVLVIDHRSDTLHVQAAAELHPWLDQHLDAALSRTRQAQELEEVAFTCADSSAEYQEKIRTAQHEIYEGNTYEVCLTTKLSARVPRFSPFEAYCRMRLTAPAPFAHYLQLENLHVASMSPERFLSLDATGMLRAEPIKGTRPRGATEREDLALKRDLETSPKDRAENIMIVDLLRNDLSHHAVPGSVKVTRLCAVEEYSTVYQMVSTIDAQLREPAYAAEALREAFPPGSMTGAPKLSTMNILHELEDRRPRGVYSGAVGYLGADGSADLSVVIRTLVAERLADQSWDLSLGVGGAITADSDPQAEWDEVITKTVGVLTALGSTFPHGSISS